MDTVSAISSNSVNARVAEGRSSVISSDFETFLKMLTAQARYQDPLQPLDSAEYASQLAQFSTVEQQVKTNELLESMANLGRAPGTRNLAEWIGLEVNVSDKFNFSGQSLSLEKPTLPVADQQFLVVKNELGDIVGRKILDIGSSRIDWAGDLDSGETVAAGFYKFEIEAFSEGNLVSTLELNRFEKIVEARISDGEVSYILESGLKISDSEVAAVRSR